MAIRAPRPDALVSSCRAQQSLCGWSTLGLAAGNRSAAPVVDHGGTASHAPAPDAGT